MASNADKTDTGRHVLATDLDGTLIPLDGHDQNQIDLQTLAAELHENEVTLVFSTGRHFDSVSHAIEQYRLPVPDWVICDVGTSLFECKSGGGFEPVAAYESHLDELIAAMPIVGLREALGLVRGLRAQENEKQGRYKLSYYADAESIGTQVNDIQRLLDRTNAPYSIIHSIDPFNGVGLIDLLPIGVSKAYALAWWSAHTGASLDEIIFAGDSGNDLDALTSGCRSIVVGNADRSIAKRVYDSHEASGWQNRLFLASESAASGVLQGCRWYGLAGPTTRIPSRLGATPVSCDRTHFRVWAPRCKSVSVDVNTNGAKVRHPLVRSEFGYFSGEVSGVGVGAHYRYVLDEHERRPDPASRFQPNGVHDVSQVIDSNSYPWTDQNWRGVNKRNLIIYELHIGSFTEGGTFLTAIERLDELIQLGITAVEVMPVAQSPGRWNWGYDGVNLFAVRNTYGHPDAFKAFVDACHGKGIAVLLDVVYNHLGPEGNYLTEFGPYFSPRHRTPWGDALNFDGRHSPPVRQFFIDNAIHWLDDYHLDGLRIDAIHYMLDDSKPSIIDELRQTVTKFSRTCGRDLHLIAESNLYDAELLCNNEHRTAYDAIWCDCLMHSIYSFAVPHLRLTQREYRGASDVAEALQEGFVFSGRNAERSMQNSIHVASRNHANPNVGSLVTALQTHDSVGNHPHGRRLHQLTSKAFQKAAASLMLLYPSIPMIFMGEESAIDSPFPFFVDFEDQRLRSAVDRGRVKEYAQHDWRNAPLPSAEETFYLAKCHDTKNCDSDMFAWYCSLIALRKSGLDEGWLAPEFLVTDFDETLGVFTLTYSCKDGGVTMIRVRLTQPQSTIPCSSKVPMSGELVLSSVRNPELDSNFIQLEPNHAVVTRVAATNNATSIESEQE